MFKFLKNIIAPKRCYGCQKLGHFLCEDCLKKLHNHTEFCYLCKKPSFKFDIHPDCKKDDFYLDKVIVLTHYKNKLIEKLIKDAKYYNKKDILADFADYLGDLLLKNIEGNIEDYVIISRPMYFLKKLFRGYNQADILARYLSINTKIIYLPNLVKKIKNTKSQSKLDRQHRQINLKNSFSINQKLVNQIKNKKIIIVDDVVSTASTLNEIAKLLKREKITKVIGIAIASD